MNDSRVRATDAALFFSSSLFSERMGSGGDAVGMEEGEIIKLEYSICQRTS